MKKILRFLLIGLLVLLAAALIVPFLVPVPPLDGTLPPEALADEDSRFIDINGITIHYKEAGQGEPVLILLHGFAASEYSWREVIGPLAEGRRVIAFDRPAFGLTERPLEWEGPNPYSTEYQPDLTTSLMDALGVERAILVGNSAGGSVALATALRYPERVEGLVLVDAAVYAGGGSPAWVRPLLGLPQVDRLGVLFVRRIQDWGRDFGRSAWHDPERISDEVWEGYTRPLRVENWDRGLWELVRASREAGLAGSLNSVQMPVLVITGDDDRIVPTEQSIRLAGELPQAGLVVIPNCGHVPHEECPQEFLEAVEQFLDANIEAAN